MKFDPYDRGFAVDPYPVYKRLRDEAPVYHNEDLKFWALSRYEDVVAAHKDLEAFSSAGGVTIEGREAGLPLLIVKDPPEHNWAKGLVTRVFGRSRMAALEPFIRTRTIELLEQAAETSGGEEFDFVAAFAVKLPLEVISELLGIPESLRAEVHQLANLGILRGEDSDPAQTAHAMFRTLELYGSLAKDRRANPGDDVVSLLINTEVKDEHGGLHRMDDQAIAIRYWEMTFAGHETVAKALPNGAMAFQRFPSERDKLARDPSLAEGAVSEILRYDPPSQLQGRTTTRDITLHGVTIPAGVKTMLCTGAATRDERRFDDPDVFDIDREVDLNSIFFGLGAHKCLGMHLARQEIAIAFQEIFARFPNFEVDPDRATRQIMSNVRGVSSLPIRLGQPAV